MLVLPMFLPRKAPHAAPTLPLLAALLLLCWWCWWAVALSPPIEPVCAGADACSNAFGAAECTAPRLLLPIAVRPVLQPQGTV